jgi:hypothetical protein
MNPLKTPHYSKSPGKPRAFLAAQVRVWSLHIQAASPGPACLSTVDTNLASRAKPKFRPKVISISPVKCPAGKIDLICCRAASKRGLSDAGKP